MPKEKTSTGKGSGDKSEKLVLDYLTKQNRPYSVITKTECQRVVNALVEKDLVTAKLYGKQAIYVVRQDTINTADAEELAVIDKEMSQLQSQIVDAKARNKQLTSELSALNSAMTTEQITHKLEQLMAKNEQSQQHLSLLRAGTELVTPEEAQRVSKDMEKHRKLWLQRRRLFKDMFAAVTENIPGKPKDLLEELDIDMQDPIDININPRDLIQV
ncbi:hypothetical protein EDD11_000929 [Mortierella claussenii]|nr:hypothetical protein EDD11_000929 [Mortierella claussenii]